MNKQEYESLKSGDKLKIVSLGHTVVGDADFEIGEVVEFVEHLLGSSSRNDLLVKHSVGYRWYMSSKDLEVVNEEDEYKVGDEVVFTKYEDDSEWENGYGGFVGEKYKINYIHSKDSIHLETTDGRMFVVGVDQIKKVESDEDLNVVEELVISSNDDLVNSPKHYATDPSGVECIQIKRKMSANAGDGADSQLLEDDKSQNKKKPFKSDGGSSPYYFSELPQHVIERIVKKGGIEIKDIIRYCFDNDADCKDIIKALKRIRECKKGGGKEGIDVMYDATKVKFFADEMYESEKANCGQ